MRFTRRRRRRRDGWVDAGKREQAIVRSPRTKKAQVSRNVAVRWMRRKWDCHAGRRSIPLRDRSASNAGEQGVLSQVRLTVVMEKAQNLRSIDLRRCTIQRLVLYAGSIRGGPRGRTCGRDRCRGFIFNYHPVKGFTPERITAAHLPAGGFFPCDRIYAVEDGHQYGAARSG